ncbi:MAG: hypothetical protein II942_02385 [Alphaproteobacteria bacterium]|nr:hypothetical protein [Alphaproteobacteria bacterium]
MDPEQNTARPPMSNAPTEPHAGPAPAPSVGQDSDLYTQIAGQDTDPQVVKKKKPSLLMSAVIAFMRMTLYFDSLRRAHEQAFHFLGLVWAFFMGVLYLSGILVLLAAVYNRLQMPILLEDQLRVRNIEFASADYSMDRIVVHELKDNNGTYTVDTLVVYSTFTDMLQKRIRLVVLDGLNIFFDTKSDFNPVQDIPAILNQIQNPARGRVDLKVNAITVNNGKLNFKNRQIEVPISFSMVGSYGRRTRIVMPLSVNQPSFQAESTLSLDHTGNQQPEWNLSISKGMITLPRSSPENINGEFKIALNKTAFDHLNADFKLGYGTIEKHITATFQATQNKDMTANVLWQKNNLTEPDQYSSLTFSVSHLTMDQMGQIHGSGRMVIDSKKFVTPNVSLDNLHTSFMGDFQCSNWTRCSLELLEKAPVSIQNLWFQYQRHGVRSTDAVAFTILPHADVLVLKDDDPYLKFYFDIVDFDMDATLSVTGEKLLTSVPKMVLIGGIADASSDASQLSLSMENFNYQTSNILIEKGILKAENLLQPTSLIKMHADKTNVSNTPLLSQDFSLDMNMVGSQTRAQLKFLETPIVVQLEGNLSLAQRAFAGRVFVPPFEVGDLPQPLSAYWPNVPANLTNFTGSLALSGQVNWGGVHSIVGPLSIGMKGMSFTINDIDVVGMNTVLTVESLVPFITAPSQHVFVQSIESLIPFQNLDVNFQVDSQGLRLNQFTTLGAGIPLSLPASVISSKSANLLMYLKNDAPITHKEFQNVVHLKDIDVTAGTANVSIPVELQNNNLEISNVTLKISNALLKFIGDTYSSVIGNDTNYYVRSGQIIMDKNRVLQLVLNGRTLPSKNAKDIQLNEVHLPDNVFVLAHPQPVPSDIEKRLGLLFK